MTDHDLPRAFCLVKCFDVFSARNGVRSQADGLHFVICESPTFGRGFFDVLEGEKCIFEVYVYDGDRR